MIIFLGGTCNQSTWREKLIPNLAVDYFNPVVEQWDEECYERELIARETADFCLFVITPKIEGLFALAEVVDTSYKRTDRTIYCYLEEDGDESFTEQQRCVLEDIGKLVEGNGAVWLKSLDEIADFFLQAAQIKPPECENDIFDVFISYGRRHSKAFAVQLRQSLIDQGYKVWLDTENIAIAVEFQQKIDEGIRYAHNFCFILSPHSVNSEYCNRELKTALTLNKRIIPIHHMDMGASEGDIPEKLQKLNWMMFNGNRTYTQTLSMLVSALNQHTEVLHPHCELLLHADKWANSLKSHEYLLYGSAMTSACNWLEDIRQARELEVFPLEEHCLFINASRLYHQDELSDICIVHHSSDQVRVRNLCCSLIQHGYVTVTETLDNVQSRSLDALLYRRLRTATFIVVVASDGITHTSAWQYVRDYVKDNQKVSFTLLENLSPEKGSDLGQIIRFDVKASNEEFCALLLLHLEQDKEYFSLRNSLFCRAAQWEERKSEGVLLTSTELVDYQQFLAIAQVRAIYGAPPLLIDFIAYSATSLAHRVDSCVDIFICADSEDNHFAHRLKRRLRDLEKSVHYVDPDYGTNDGALFKEMMASSSRVIAVLPRHCSSHIDNLLQLANDLNKPITFVKLKRFRDTTYDESYQSYWQVAFEVDELLEVSLTQLLTKISGNAEYLESYRYWSQKLHFWKEQHQAEEFLLGNTESILASAWLEGALAHTSEPSPPESLVNFIDKSRAFVEQGKKNERRNKHRLKAISVLSLVLCCVSLLLGVKAISDGRVAEAQTLAIQLKNIELEKKTEEANRLAKQAEAASLKAQEKTVFAMAQTELANKQKLRAEKEKENAQKQKDLALSLKLQAEQSQRAAILHQAEAQNQAHKALRLKQIAEIEALIYQAQIQNEGAERISLAVRAYKSLLSLKADVRNNILYNLLYREIKTGLSSVHAHDAPVEHLTYIQGHNALLSIDSSGLLVSHKFMLGPELKKQFEYQLPFRVNQLVSNVNRSVLLNDKGRIYELTESSTKWALVKLLSDHKIEKILTISDDAVWVQSGERIWALTPTRAKHGTFLIKGAGTLFVNQTMTYLFSHAHGYLTLWQKQGTQYQIVWQARHTSKVTHAEFVANRLVFVDANSVFSSYVIDEQNQVILSRRGKAHEHPISSAFYVPSKQQMISTGVGGTVKFWPFGAHTSNRTPIEIQHANWVYSAAHVKKQDASFIYLGTDSGHLVPLPLDIHYLVKQAEQIIAKGTNEL
ncbi:TIR domain-containing protein [Pseudoalteromonas sp. SMS1]|uniref:TIR domain-containing protein n=1 Tax=Pseudoalteromonas sp. SMS1 TaxID=2908894 RepID=UPI001F4241F9|nr:TIR domain-containing protein [Pseudoalteromonas sp. SMS1]MCF2858715.1 TIR domain-containing protein [Pseudoalteromonas sp. SMS1]